jgi:hypothetical protein
MALDLYVAAILRGKPEHSFVAGDKRDFVAAGVNQEPLLAQLGDRALVGLRVVASFVQAERGVAEKLRHFDRKLHSVKAQVVVAVFEIFGFFVHVRLLPRMVLLMQSIVTD